MSKKYCPYIININLVYKFVLLSIFHSQIFKFSVLLDMLDRNIECPLFKQDIKKHNKVIKYFRYCPYADYNLIQNKIYIFVSTLYF